MNHEPRARGRRRRRRGARDPGGGRIRRRIHLLPHLFTLGNLFAGFFAVTGLLTGQLDRAALAIGIGFLMDSFDGMVARLVHTDSPMGVQLDSLADVVTFGIAPALLAVAWGTGALDPIVAPHAIHVRRLAWIAAFAFLSASALRLARFNVMTGDDSEPPRDLPPATFIGMPTPTAASCIAATVHFFKLPIVDWRWGALWAVVTFALAALMISRIPFPSPKKWMANPRAPALWLLGLALLLAAIYYYSEVVLMGLLLVYLSFVVAFNVRRARRRRRGETSVDVRGSMEDESGADLDVGA